MATFQKLSVLQNSPSKESQQIAIENRESQALQTNTPKQHTKALESPKDHNTNSAPKTPAPEFFLGLIGGVKPGRKAPQKLEKPWGRWWLEWMIPSRILKMLDLAVVSTACQPSPSPKSDSYEDPFLFSEHMTPDSTLWALRSLLKKYFLLKKGNTSWGLKKSKELQQGFMFKTHKKPVNISKPTRKPHVLTWLKRGWRSCAFRGRRHTFREGKMPPFRIRARVLRVKKTSD